MTSYFQVPASNLYGCAQVVIMDWAWLMATFTNVKAHKK